MAAMVTGVLAMGIVAALDRVQPAGRRALAYTAVGAAGASIFFLLLGAS